MHDRERANAIHSEVAILVRISSSKETSQVDPLDELEGLARTAGSLVVAGMTQKRDVPNATTYLGKGKVEELKELVEFHEADVVIFDNDLSPAQVRNLEIALDVKVLDRTELILDIFASNAQTYESRLAVELAQLEYSLPRLKRMWTHLSRMKMGVGMRGPGEKQLEVDRRLVEKRIHELRSELSVIESRKERQVSGRKQLMAVSLVGYTNAGKSTLMNALTAAGVLAEDKLFATLDTRTRRWRLPNWGPVLLSDTVGFIRDLPHRLITSFQATLEEAKNADLLLHIADGSSPAVCEQISAVYSVLEELGINEKDTLLIVNKIDEMASPAVMQGIKNRYPNALAISAKTEEGFEKFAIAVSDALSRTFVDVDVKTGVDNGKLMAYLAAHGEVLSRTYEDENVTMHCRIPEQFLGRISPEEASVSRRDVESEEDDNSEPSHSEPSHSEPGDSQPPDSPSGKTKDVEDVA